MKYNWVSILFIFLCGCHSIGTTTIYNKNLTISNSESEVIYLSFANTKHAPYYFILTSTVTDVNPTYLLKVRWVNPDKNNKQFSTIESSLKFIINKEKVITLMPIKEPVLSAYDMNKGVCEEETTYSITRNIIEQIAHAKTVEVELTGKHKVVIGEFNKWHSFRAFKNFLKNG